MAEYGRFGRAAYDRNDKEWHFERAVTNPRLRQIGSSKIVRLPVAPALPKRQGGSIQTDNEIKALVRSHPELQPASDLLARFERVSKAVEDAALHHDPMKGELLAFGSIHRRDHRVSVEVVAYPSGPTGGELHLTQLQKRRRVVDEGVTVEVPAIVDEAAIWKGPGVPIQSIGFAQQAGADGPTFLAVRLITEIVLFQLEAFSIAQPKSFKIELKLVHRISINDTASFPYAHVSFNLWSNQQFAFVDQAGSWAVMQMDEGKVRSTTLVYRNDLANNTEDEPRTPLDDGWGRILWVAVPTILIICNRRKTILFDQEQLTSQELPEVATVLDDRVNWNLDVAVVNAHPNYAILLTTSHIVVYNITRGEDELLISHRVICTRHFRNAGDLSLRLYVCQDGDDTLVFIRSDLDSTIIYYRLNLSDPERITFSDPRQLTLLRDLGVTKTSSRVISMHMHPLSRNEHFNSRVEMSSLHRLPPSKAQSYLLTTLHEDMSMLQTLYASGFDGDHTIHEPEEQVGSSLEKATRLPYSGSSRELGSPFVRQPKTTGPAKSSEEWTISYELTMRQLDDVSISAVDNVGIVLGATLNNLRSANVDDHAPNETLQEQFRGDIQADDLAEVREALNNFRDSLRSRQEDAQIADDLDRTETSGQPVLRAITWPSNLHTEDPFDLGVLHLSIVDNWVSPLPDAIPETIRSIQEQHALQLTTEVALAQLVIRPGEPHDSHLISTAGQTRGFEIPVRASVTPGSSRATPSVYLDASSQPQSSARATPSTPGTPSTTTSVDKPPEVSRLSRYTNITVPPSTALPRSLNRVLSHWTLGADPAYYDWRNATRRVNRQIEEEEGEELTEKERVRQQRRRQRHERRQQRHEEERQRQELLHSQAPEIFTESQPTQGSFSYGFSQATGGSQMPASQILPGRHGGRPPPKKKRKSGF